MEYKVKLIKENDDDILRFFLNKEFDINLNSNDQSSIKNLFHEIIKIALDDDLKFNLDTSEHEQDLFYDVAQDYINKLNNEIQTIRKEIPQKIK